MRQTVGYISFVSCLWKKPTNKRDKSTFWFDAMYLSLSFSVYLHIQPPIISNKPSKAISFRQTFSVCLGRIGQYETLIQPRPKQLVAHPNDIWKIGRDPSLFNGNVKSRRTCVSIKWHVCVCFAVQNPFIFGTKTHAPPQKLHLLSMSTQIQS